MKTTFKQAQAALEQGKINGIRLGERVCAKRDTCIVSDDGKLARMLRQARANYLPK